MRKTSEKEIIKLNDILHLSNKEIEKTRIRFMVDSGNFKPIEMAKNEDGENKLLNALVHNSKTKMDFKKDGIAIGFITFDKDKWLMTGIADIIKDNGFNKPAEAKYRNEKFNFRIVVKYHKKGQNGIRKAKTIIDELEVLEVWSPSQSLNDEMFPGYKNVNISFLDLKKKLAISKEWKTSLKCRKGIYLITDKKNGKRYVGSAYGKKGIYGRWKVYIDKGGYDKNEKENGEYPNKEFKRIIKERGKKYIEKNFQYSILETFADDARTDEIIKRELWWKEVLLSRKDEYGYNKN